MVRTVFAAGLLGMLIALAGCRMCQGPFDYCGPVWDRDGHKNCDPCYRAGSILNAGSPKSPLAAAAPKRPTPAPRPTAEKAKPEVGSPQNSAPAAPPVDPAVGAVEGATRVLSITDKKFDPAEPEPTAQAEAPRLSARDAPQFTAQVTADPW